MKNTKAPIFLTEIANHPSDNTSNASEVKNWKTSSSETNKREVKFHQAQNMTTLADQDHLSDKLHKNPQISETHDNDNDLSSEDDIKEPYDIGINIMDLIPLRAKLRFGDLGLRMHGKLLFETLNKWNGNYHVTSSFKFGNCGQLCNKISRNHAFLNIYAKWNNTTPHPTRTSGNLRIIRKNQAFNYLSGLRDPLSLKKIE